ncbi:MAG TPA: hypothetical protein PKY59_08565 [Pyrinomonadaceae bacterium]|nr:hypothetical protein [Pyrinomonadaceae bacterium]
MRHVLFAIFIALMLFSATSIYAQKTCLGEQIFTEKNCSGDEISKDEIQLQTIINQYRKENNLPEIEISKPLSIVANRHLIDLQTNIKSISHSWSNCPYDLKDEKTWNCVTDAPKRLKVDFNGRGFENLYHNLNANANPSLALEAWKKSPLHNSLILNLGNWNNKKWVSIGISIRGQFAAIWFGSDDSDDSKANFKTPKGLGLTFLDVVKNLSNVVSIQKTSTVLENDKWVGASKDKGVILELYGKTEDISEASLFLKIKLDPQNSISERNKNLVLIYLKNIFGSTEEASKWFDANLPKLLSNKNSAQSFIKDNKILELRIDKTNYLTLNTKPYRKNNGGAIEIFE